MRNEIRVKRVYEEPAATDGFRILVDRLWPRGVSKDVARIDLWEKQLTPSHELRKWFHEDAARHEEFVARFHVELESRRHDLTSVLAGLDHPMLTLVSATRDLSTGHVAVLKAYLENWFGRSTPQA